MVLLHVLALLVMAFKLRKAKDGFSIKSELRGFISFTNVNFLATGIWWLLVIVALLASVAFLEGYKVLYVLLLGYVGAYFTVIVFPLFRAYVKPHKKYETLICAYCLELTWKRQTSNRWKTFSKILK